MARKHHKPEEIVGKLRQVEVLVGQGRPVAEAIRAINVTEPTYCSSARSHGISRGFWHYDELRFHLDHPVGAGQLPAMRCGRRSTGWSQP